MKVGNRYLIRYFEDKTEVIQEVKITEISKSNKYIKLVYEPYANINSENYWSEWIDPVKLDIIEELPPCENFVHV